MTSEKRIQYSGIVRALPQSNSREGSCQEMINVRIKKGCLRPIGKKDLYSIGNSYAAQTFAQDYTEIYLHDIENGIMSGEPNWIGYKKTEGKLYVINPMNGISDDIESFTATPNKEVNIVFLKRTMIVTSDNGVGVFLFNSDKQYIQTASLPVPDTDLTRINSEYVTTDQAFYAEGVLGNYFAKLNSVSSSAGKIYGSIMYITAYKLFDGSYILPSIPRYFEISNGGVFHRANPGGGSSADRLFDMRFYVAALRATINNELYTASIGDTKDLISSICIFSTRPQPVHKIDDTIITDQFLDAFSSVESEATQEFKTKLPLNDEFTKLAKSEGWYLIHEFNFEDVVGKTGRTTIDIDTKGFYQDYATRDTLTTDQFTHHKLKARFPLVYNDRLHLLNIKTQLGLPYVVWPDSTEFLGSTNTFTGKITVWLKTSLGQAVRQKTTNIPVYMASVQQTTTYTSSEEAEYGLSQLSSNPNYIADSGYINSRTITDPYETVYDLTWKEYDTNDANSYFVIPEVVGYNDSRAYKMQIAVNSGAGYKVLFEENLLKNESMNFSYWVPTSFTSNEDSSTDNYKVTKKLVSSVTTAATIPDEIELPYDTNRLQVSEIQNPLVFPAKNSYQVGTGDGLAIASGSEPLSTGQFGQFPLQVFTTKGIWCLEVGLNDVLYTNILPVSDEVIENPKNVISIGSGVVYSTVNGLFIVNGRQSVQLSEVVEGVPELVENLTWITALTTSEPTNTRFTPGLSNALSETDFINYITGSTIGFDRINQELIVSNKNYGYSYIYSFESKVWTKISQSYLALINSYPRLIGITNTNMYDLTKELNYEHVEIIIVSNAQTIDGTETLKKIERAIQYAKVSTGTGKYFGFYVWTSDDLTTWQLITGKQKTGAYIKDAMIQRSHGSAKYYVFAVNGKVSFDTEIREIIIWFKNKWINRLR